MSTTSPPAAGPKPIPASPSSLPGEKHQGHHHLIWGLIAGVVIVSGIGYARFRGAHQKQAKPAAPPPLQVSAAVAQKGEIGVFVPGLGVVTPIYTVMVKCRVDGQLLKVNYTEGQFVRQGDPLVEIDPKPFEAQLLQAEGQFQRDSALLENAQLDLSRYKEAYAKNAIPKQLLDTQQASVHQYEGAVKFDQGQIDTAKVQLDYCHVAAPISGRVGLRLIDPGNVVHANDTNPLVVITQLDPITVVFGVAEDFLPQIQEKLKGDKHLPVEAYDRAQQRKIATGTLMTLDNQVDPGTGTVKFKGLFTNTDDSLFPNQFVNAKLLVDTQRGAVIPTAAIQRNAQGAFVYIIKPDMTAAMQAINPGVSDATNTVVQGLNPGDKVATDNFNRLQDGSKVNVREPGGGGGGGEGKRKGRA